MHRFYVLKENIIDNTITLSEDDAKHAVRVLRMTVGEPFLVCDGENHEYSVIVEQVNKNALVGRIESMRTMDSETKTAITLFQGYPKASKLEWILQKGTEIGVKQFVPFYSAYGDVKQSKNDKLERYERIIYEAGKQAGRGVLPILAPAIGWGAVLNQLDSFDVVIVAYEAEKKHHLVLDREKHKNIALMVGPEGGFSPEEISDLQAKKAEIVTLGKRILRTETAGIIFPALVLYELGEME